MWLLPYMQGAGSRKTSLPQLNLIFSILTALKALEERHQVEEQVFIPFFQTFHNNDFDT